MPRLPQQPQDPGKEAERRLPVDLPPDPGRRQHRTIGVRLPCQPGEEPLGSREVALVVGAMICAQHLGERRIAAGEVGQLVFEPLFGRISEGGVVLANPAQAGDLVPDLVQPPLDDGLECVGAVRGRLDPLDQTAVDRLEVMQRRVVDRNLDLGRRESPSPRPTAQVPCRERLPRAVFTPKPFREPLAGCDEVQLELHRLQQSLQAGGEAFEAAPRHQPVSQGVDDLGRDGRFRHQLSSRCS